MSSPGYISTFPVGKTISLSLNIKGIFTSSPEKIPGNILNGVLIIGQDSFMDIPIILAIFPPK